jgi:hypothetical protein
MIASLAAHALQIAPLRLLLRVTASSLSTLRHASIAETAQRPAPLTLPFRNNLSLKSIAAPNSARLCFFKESK